jgi:hypothetical protein
VWVFVRLIDDGKFINQFWEICGFDIFSSDY